MSFFRQEKTALFVDGSNLYATCRALRFQIDTEKFLAHIQRRADLAVANYYTAVDVQDNGTQNIRGFITRLKYQGYKVVEKRAHVFHNDMGIRTVKGNMDIEMAMGIVTTAPHVDRVILVTGDRDFIPVVNWVHSIYRKVTVISTIKTSPPMCSPDLVSVTDEFKDLADMIPTIMRLAA